MSPRLADLTIGSGPGTPMRHLNHLVSEVTSPYVVVVDDDVQLICGSISRLVEIADRHGLDLCQPAQAPDGHWSHAITLRRPLSAVGLAIVDVVEQVHLTPPGLSYPQEAEMARLEAALQELKSTSISALVATSAVVRPWEL